MANYEHPFQLILISTIIIPNSVIIGHQIEFNLQDVAQKSLM